ncbi:hypothetical protein Tco_0841964 [Tanacetum coccineum]|uniref:Uncharacterized protein n=1 Tax=Tanacetum coccineum TaxID=301880 RepID=A0ABQ5B062_9ASTR
MPDPSKPTPQKKRERPSGSGTKHRVVDVDHKGKGNIIDHIEVLFNRASKERLGNKEIKSKGKEKVIVDESVDDKAVRDNVKITNEIYIKR